MGTFSSRFVDDEDASSGRPECYGDPDYYDITNDVCRQCRFKGTCRLKVGALDREQRRASVPNTAHVTPTASPGGVYRSNAKGRVFEDPGKDESFTSVLAYNAGLNAVTTMSETLTEALAQIPRKKYPSLRRRPIE
jgi:hypothetical protein